MSTNKPREFWITLAQRKMYVFNDSKSAEHCAKMSDDLHGSTGSYVIHVIENKDDLLTQLYHYLNEATYHFKKDPETQMLKGDIKRLLKKVEEYYGK